MESTTAIAEFLRRNKGVAHPQVRQRVVGHRVVRHDVAAIHHHAAPLHDQLVHAVLHAQHAGHIRVAQAAEVVLQV